MALDHNIGVPAGGAAELPRSYLAGLGMSNDTDTAHDIAIAVGECRNNADDADMSLSSILVKRIDANWVVGTGNGGISSSLTIANDTWYHVHIITVSGTDDAGFDTSVVAANLIADHSATAFRRIGSVLTDGSSNIIAFVQVGEEFLWSVSTVDFNTANPGTSAVTVTLTTPIDVVTLAKMVFRQDDSSPTLTVNGVVTPLDTTDTAPSSVFAHTLTISSKPNSIAEIFVRTNTSAQIRYRISGSDAGIVVRNLLFGWIDTRGRDD